MIVEIDSSGFPTEVLNAVKVILGDGTERHITVTHEGIVIDIIVAGEVVDTRSFEHDDLLAIDPNAEDGDL